ncbi:hypothetical protein LJB89_00995 [Tyzzerella sp. OttesenSCG-928-J15]|nr:hypothetical protein [Tyzzerella sp. OttesenSCG-928-J15]
MNKLIGGLLIISLLSRPAILRVDFIAYEFFKSNTVIINSLKKEDLYIEEESDDEVINNLMDTIDGNKRTIDNLMEEKRTIVANLDNVMKEKAVTRQALNSEFILEFQEFNKIYNEERGDVEYNIDTLNSTDFTAIQQNMLHNEVDYSYIIAEFEEVIESQNKVITFLESLVNKGKDTLALC